MMATTPASVPVPPTSKSGRLARLSAWLHRVSNVWTALAAVALYVFFLATVMPAQSTDSRRYAGDWGAPDGHLFYTPDTLYAELANWDAAGRADYIDFRLGPDFIWAIAYTGFLVTLTSPMLRRVYPAGDWRRQLNLPALIPLLCDYAENGLGIWLVAHTETRLDALAWLAAGTTCFKWVTLVIAHLILLFAAAASIRSLVRR